MRDRHHLLLTLILPLVGSLHSARLPMIWISSLGRIPFKWSPFTGQSVRQSCAISLTSVSSVSKGFLGECGLRGGYFEMLGIDDEVKMQLYKLASMSLASNTLGMLTVGLMVNPPKNGDESYALYAQERDDILSSMRRRAQVMNRALNGMTGVTCNEIEGAMYAFPTITLPREFLFALDPTPCLPDSRE